MTHELDVRRVRGEVSSYDDLQPARGSLSGILLGTAFWVCFSVVVYVCLVEASQPYGGSLMAR